MTYQLMTSQTKTKLARRSPSVHTGSSFEKETQSLLRNRLLLLFAIGFFIASAAYLNELFFALNRDDILKSFLTPWYDELWWSHPISFIIGMIAVFVFSRSARILYWIAFIVMSFNITALVFFHAAFTPGTAPLFVLALLLFIHAAFVPIPVRFQIGLAAVAFISYPLFHLLAVSICEVVQAYWAGHGGYMSLQSVLYSNMVSIATLGIITVLVNKTLYNMRQKLFKAKRLGNYILKDKLGEGGMGEVYVGHHEMLCRPTAIKVLKTDNDDQQTALARFEREVRLSAMLTHPNTITIFDYGRTSDNTFYYAMEFLEGMDLQHFVEKFGPIPAERVVFMLLQVCESLAEAHLRNIIHRDIKPSNIFLTRRGGLYDFVKVLDFGLAKQQQSKGKSGITQTGAFFGTPRYVAPESIYGNATVDLRADLYNLGAVAYWMLTGQPLFANSSSVELLVDHAKTVPPKPSEVSELDIPPELDAIVMKCLEKKPEDRFQAAMDLYLALKAIPFKEPWTFAHACEWWGLHINFEDDFHICPNTGEVMKPVEISRQDSAQAV